MRTAPPAALAGRLMCSPGRLAMKRALCSRPTLAPLATAPRADAMRACRKRKRSRCCCNIRAAGRAEIRGASRRHRAHSYCAYKPHHPQTRGVSKPGASRGSCNRFADMAQAVVIALRVQDKQNCDPRDRDDAMTHIAFAADIEYRRHVGVENWRCWVAALSAPTTAAAAVIFISLLPSRRFPLTERVRVALVRPEDRLLSVHDVLGPAGASVGGRRWS